MKVRIFSFVVANIFLSAMYVFSASRFPMPGQNPWVDDYSAVASLENFSQWGTYNVHDPSVIRVGDRYYMYSTDAIYFQRRTDGKRPDVKMGNIQMRSSADLVHWKFEGWAFDSIPADSRQWVLAHSDNKGATNIWAPYPVYYNGKFRLYYCVSAFGLQTSYIGMAESTSPLGPWEMKGAVVKTKRGDPMNAIDPSIVADANSGRMWMHYGSYFGGLYAVELNPLTGLPATDGDKGHFIATRANIKKDNIEAPEIVYNPRFKKYYLFCSYDPLMTTYNVRVGRADKPEGPFLDFFGNDLRDSINHYPILTHPYRFDNHPGWAGTGHCGVFADAGGKFFMAHQGRLCPENQLMDLHLREIKWTVDGWPVVSPERYAATVATKFGREDLIGEWEVIRVQDAKTDRQLEFGQILWGEGALKKTEVDRSVHVMLKANGMINESDGWAYEKSAGLRLRLKSESVDNLIVFCGHDWENGKETLLFTGLDKNGCSVWGKKIK